MKLINVLNARSVITGKAQVKGINFKTSFKFINNFEIPCYLVDKEFFLWYTICRR